MKKLLSLLLVLFASFALFACAGTGDAGGDKKTEEANKGPGPNAKVITFCTWDWGTEEAYNLKRRMVDKFNEDHYDEIYIEVVMPDGDYDTFLSTMAGARNLPDVFMVNSVPSTVINHLAYDLTTIAGADAEWATIDESLRTSVTYNGHIFGIPAGQYYMGFMANYKLLDKYLDADELRNSSEIFAPGAFTTEDFIKMVKATRSIDQKGTSVVGLNATGDIINWLPSVLDETGKTGHFVWNAETRKIGYRSQIMYDALTIINELGNKAADYTFDSVIAEAEKDAKKAYFGTTEAVNAFNNGQIGFFQDSTVGNFKDSEVLDYCFIGYPDSRVVSASDFMCISRQTKNIEAAWEVAKYFSFGVEGTEAKFSIVDANPDANLKVVGIPLVNNPQIANKWFDYVTLKGAKEVYDGVIAGDILVLVEANKTVPGYQEARFKTTTGIAIEGHREGKPMNMSDYIWDVCSGDISVSDYQTQFTQELEDKMNGFITDGDNRIKELTK